MERSGSFFASMFRDRYRKRARSALKGLESVRNFVSRKIRNGLLL